MNFEKYEFSTNIKELRQTMEELAIIMGPEYDLQTSMIAYHEPEAFETMCSETHEISSARINSLYQAKAHDIEFINDKEKRGLVPELEQRKRIFEVYKLYALFDEQFASDDDATIHDMQRRVISRIYDDEIADHQFFADNAKEMLQKRDRYAKPLRWITSAVFALSLGTTGYAIAHTLENKSSEVPNNDMGLDIGMGIGSTAIGWHLSRGIKETKNFKKASNGFARVVAKKKTHQALRRVISE